MCDIIQHYNYLYFNDIQINSMTNHLQIKENIFRYEFLYFVKLSKLSPVVVNTTLHSDEFIFQQFYQQSVLFSSIEESDKKRNIFSGRLVLSLTKEKGKTLIAKEVQWTFEAPPFLHDFFYPMGVLSSTKEKERLYQ